MAIIMDGKAVSAEVKEAIKNEVEAIINQRKPKLVVVLVGEDPASQTYVGAKQRACELVGILSEAIKVDQSISQEELLAIINKLNQDESVDGILVQLPLPKHLNEKEVMLFINPKKDVDGFHPINVGKLHLKQETFVPATPKGVMKLIEDYDIDVTGKKALVIGRSDLVGRPIAQLLVNANATVTIAHSKTKNLQKLCKDSEIIVVAIGIKHFIKKEWLTPGVVLIDVGIHRTKDNKLTGDAEPSCAEVALYMTPVPKGVGPMTIAMLLENTMQAYRKRIKS
jgi:methylenetetrahydrofolate dehydrogenase (NADP+)/methenyltetrahydrofolate cyclohydrolase